MKMGIEMPDDLVEILTGIRDELSAIRRLMESQGMPQRDAPREMKPASREPEPMPRRREPEPSFESTENPYRSLDTEWTPDEESEAPAPVSMAAQAAERKPAPIDDAFENESPPASSMDDTSHDAALMNLLGSMEMPPAEPSAEQSDSPRAEDSSKFDLSMDELEKIFGLDESKK